jgi:protein TonB
MATTLIRNAMLATILAASASSAVFAAPPPEWIAKARQMLAAKQEYPRAAQMRGDEGTARVKLSVGADGAISEIELVQPTGSSTLDREAVAVPHKVGVFPAPPGGAAVIVVPLTWKMM